MIISLAPSQLSALGLSEKDSIEITNKVNTLSEKLSPIECWQIISSKILQSSYPFLVHKFLYSTIFPDWDKTATPAWIPTSDFVKSTNIAKTMAELSINTYPDFHTWSVKNYEKFWDLAIKKLDISFDRPYQKIVDLSEGVETPQWLPDAKLNIASSCFTSSKNAIAIIHQTENSSIKKITYGELDELSNCIANSITKHFQPGDAIAICMPMTATCVAIYLGIIKAGCSVVSIADSFAPEEIATRIKITHAKGIFTQDHLIRGGKKLSIYPRVTAANTPKAIVLACENSLSETLRHGDLAWDEFLINDKNFKAVSCNPHDTINILFSSGTTGDPKAIPWNHTTAIKAAVDAYFHHNIQPEDILAWPTNIGWMMGPWLIFAGLLNHATIALFDGTPLNREFGEFIQNAKITMLGVVPSIVKIWRSTACMEDLDWSAIKLFSSTGECSNIEDMLYLMSLAGYRPIIEYCGGTEIGGGYVTGTMIQPSAPAAFTTPALGLDFIMLDDAGQPANCGEIAIIPPSIGLSTELLNKNHHKVYFEKMPKSPTGQILRRHGDQLEKLDNGYYRVQGRVDDTMNLGAIKVSSAEIERALAGTPNIIETAAIAEAPLGGGPSELVIFAVPQNRDQIDLPDLKITMQNKINKQLNPLFKINHIVLIDVLPRTASNKVMRRTLRAQYKAESETVF